LEGAAIRINELFGSRIISPEFVIGKVNQLINEQEKSSQLEIHSKLTYESLRFLFEKRDMLNIADGVKEHLVWWYFKVRIEKCNGEISDRDFDKLLEVFSSTQYISLESIVISVLKANHHLTEGQLQKADNIFASKAYRKERFGYSRRMDILKGKIMDIKQVQKLIEFRLYSVLEMALEKGCLSHEGVRLLSTPYSGTTDKKIRLKLAQLAQKKL